MTQIEAKARLKVTAAPISSGVERKFIAELFKHAKLAELGLYAKSGEIRSQASLTVDQVDDLISRIKGAGFSKTWKPRGFSKRALGFATPDGKWPIVVDAWIDESKKGLFYNLEITLGGHDTLDKSEKKLDMDGFKALVREVAKTLKVRVDSNDVHYNSTGFSSDVFANSVTVDSATNLLKKYGTPKVQKSPSYKGGVLMDFKVEHATLRLTFVNTLRSITCMVI